jgi:hypothetical protein
MRIVGIDFRDGILFVPEVLNADGKGTEIIALPSARRLRHIFTMRCRRNRGRSSCAWKTSE